MTKAKLLLLWAIIISPFLASLLLIQLTAYEFFGELPTFDQLENPQSNLATEIISSDGKVLGKYFFENRSQTKYSELPENLINALIATEDIRFRSHSGIDIRSLLRAVVGAIFKKENSGGASTISQQLAKMLFTKKPSSGIERVVQKLKEWVISARLEKHYTKDEIITMYLNRFDWVNNAVGIKSASRVYFNKKPSELKLEEAATLVGMLKNSALYNPNRRLKFTEERRNVVLSQMKKYKFINNEISVAGVITEVEHRVSRQGKGWATFILEDYIDSHDFRIFGEEYLRFKHFLNINNFLHLKIKIVDGWLNKETGLRGEPRILYTNFKLLQDVISTFSNKIFLDKGILILSSITLPNGLAPIFLS